MGDQAGTRGAPEMLPVGVAEGERDGGEAVIFEFTSGLY